jgi:hypothetical protein
MTGSLGRWDVRYRQIGPIGKWSHGTPPLWFPGDTAWRDGIPQSRRVTSLVLGSPGLSVDGTKLVTGGSTPR